MCSYSSTFIDEKCLATFIIVSYFLGVLRNFWATELANLFLGYSPDNMDEGEAYLNAAMNLDDEQPYVNTMFQSKTTLGRTKTDKTPIPQLRVTTSLKVNCISQLLYSNLVKCFIHLKYLVTLDH